MSGWRRHRMKREGLEVHINQFVKSKEQSFNQRTWSLVASVSAWLRLSTFMLGSAVSTDCNVCWVGEQSK